MIMLIVAWLLLFTGYVSLYKYMDPYIAIMAFFISFAIFLHKVISNI